MSQRPKFFILDAYSLIYQVFHAIPEMTGPDGAPTNAVFGVFRDILTIINDRKPEYLAVAFDGPGPVFRSDILPEYKAQRKPMPDELIAQLPVIRRVYEGFHVPILEFEGYEADDVIATLARRGAERDLEVFIATSDKDARQLLTDRIHIYNLRKKEVLDVEGLKKDWGVKPEQVVDLLALTGDAVDNVPGIPGVGLKTATSLLQQFGDLESLLAGAAKVSGKKRQENLRDHAETARRAKRLIELRDDLPLELDWNALKLKPADVRELKTLCRECGFHRFIQELGDDPDQPEIPWDYNQYVIIDTKEKLNAFVAEYAALDRFSVDTETTSVDPHSAGLVGLSFCHAGGSGAYIPVRGPMGARTLAQSEVVESLRPILENPASEKIGQNVKFDLIVLANAGIDLAGPITDTMILSYLLESGERNHNLDDLSQRLLNHKMIPISELIGKGKHEITMDLVDIRKAADYAVEDADAAWRLEEILKAKVVEEGLWNLYAELERPLVGVLAAMERAGIAVDVDRLKRLSKEFQTRLESLETDIVKHAGGEFNIASGPQLRKILFEDLKLPVRQKTPGGEPSTAQEVLEELAALHPLPRLIIEHRGLSKLKSTYLDALPQLVHPDGRVRASFNQVVTATGRLSSSDPNLQNIPVRTEDGRQIRQAFVPGEPGWELLTADYSQIELRVLAHFSRDRALVQAFESDQDIHTVVAAKIFGVPEKDVNSERRRVAKTVNFGVIYGLSAFGLAGRLGISQTEAAAFIESYFQQYSGVDAFISRVLEEAKSKGRVETILGRRRAINGVKSTTGRSRNVAERTAINTVIQGSAADLIKRAMIDVTNAIKSNGLKARMLLQIHDELVFEAPASEIETLAAIVRKAMTEAIAFEVPIKVDIGRGANWLDVETIE
jgi:DNA polymerase-1